jgi:murein L,D-transpeptidase YcbB/YkuD
MIRAKYFLVIFSLFFGFFSSSLVGKNFDIVAQAIITKSLHSQPRSSYLKRMYQISGNRPIWVTSHNLTPIAKQLITRVLNDPMLDHRTKIYQNARSILANGTSSSLFGGRDSISKHIKLEFKLSQLFKNYGNYTIYGMIHWGHFKILFKRQAGLNDVYADWEIYPKYTLYTLLRAIMVSGDLNTPFETLTPRTRLYTKLKRKLEEYRQIARSGGWSKIKISSKITLGQSNAAIPAIRERLALSGDLKGCQVNDSPIYDSCLFESVKIFQKRNGQLVDGVIGKGTAQALSQSIDSIITKIRLNLDRIKMMKRHDSGRHIMVNIPAFELYFYQDGDIIQSMRVVTGSKTHPTPIFSESIKTIVLNPYWNVPTSIIQKEMIPKLLRNKNAMKRQNIEVRNGWGPDAKTISPSSVDWSKYRYSKSVPYRFAQLPGYKNALGKVKFLFPNKFSVYMHDTPQKHLFKRHTRAYSHGCIRLQNPIALLKTFATFNDNVDYDLSKKRLKGKKQIYLNLNEDVPVDVTYLTAWVDPSGTLQMRNDIYNYDNMQLKYQRRY